MSKKVAGHLTSREEAESVVSELMDRGFSSDDIVMRSSSGTERMGDGSDTIVEVNTFDEASAKQASDILYKHNAVDIEAGGVRL